MTKIDYDYTKTAKFSRTGIFFLSLWCAESVLCFMLAFKAKTSNQVLTQRLQKTLNRGQNWLLFISHMVYFYDSCLCFWELRAVGFYNQISVNFNKHLCFARKYYFSLSTSKLHVQRVTFLFLCNLLFIEWTIFIKHKNEFMQIVCKTTTKLIIKFNATISIIKLRIICTEICLKFGLLNDQN